jgi:hypothetical protein
MTKYKHNLGHSKGLKNMITKYTRITKLLEIQELAINISNDLYVFLGYYFK